MSFVQNFLNSQSTNYYKEEDEEDEETEARKVSNELRKESGGFVSNFLASQEGKYDPLTEIVGKEEKKPSQEAAEEQKEKEESLWKKAVGVVKKGWRQLTGKEGYKEGEEPKLSMEKEVRAFGEEAKPEEPDISSDLVINTEHGLKGSRDRVAEYGRLKTEVDTLDEGWRSVMELKEDGLSQSEIKKYNEDKRKEFKDLARKITGIEPKEEMGKKDLDVFIDDVVNTELEFQQLLQESKGLIDTEKDVLKKWWKDMKDGVFLPVIKGQITNIDSIATKEAIRKRDAGEKLTEKDRLMLTKNTNLDLGAYVDKGVPYNILTGLPDSVRYMLEFALFNSVTGGLGFVPVIGSIAKAFTFDIGEVATTARELEEKKYRLVETEDGFKYEVERGGYKSLNAWTRSSINQVVQNEIERFLGERVAKYLTKPGGKKVAEIAGKTKTGKAVIDFAKPLADKLGSEGARTFLREFAQSGFLGEVAEEYAQKITDNVIMGEPIRFTWDEFLTTVGSVAVISGGTSAISTTINGNKETFGLSEDQEVSVVEESKKSKLPPVIEAELKKRGVSESTKDYFSTENIGKDVQVGDVIAGNTITETDIKDISRKIGPPLNTSGRGSQIAELTMHWLRKGKVTQEMEGIFDFLETKYPEQSEQFGITKDAVQQGLKVEVAKKIEPEIGKKSEVKTKPEIIVEPVKKEIKKEKEEIKEEEGVKPPLDTKEAVKQTEKQLMEEALEYESVEEFINVQKTLRSHEIVNEFEQGRAELSFESTCINCEGGADFVNAQVDEAIELSKKSEPIKILLKQEQIDRDFLKDSEVFINDDYVILRHSAIEHFYKIDGTKDWLELAKTKQQLKDIYKSATQKVTTKELKEREVKFTGKEIAREVKELGSDQGGINDFTLEQIRKESYRTEIVKIVDLRKLDADLDKYLKSSKVREYVGVPFKMNPVVTASGEVLDGYNRIAQAVKDGDKEIQVLRGVKKEKAQKKKVAEKKPAKKKVLLSSQKKIDRARELGADAVKRGVKRVPAQDSKLMSLLKGVSGKQSEEILMEWLDAYDEGITEGIVEKPKKKRMERPKKKVLPSTKKAGWPKGTEFEHKGHYFKTTTEHLVGGKFRNLFIWTGKDWNVTDSKRGWGKFGKNRLDMAIRNLAIHKKSEEKRLKKEKGVKKKVLKGRTRVISKQMEVIHKGLGLSKDTAQGLPILQDVMVKDGKARMIGLEVQVEFDTALVDGLYKLDKGVFVKDKEQKVEDYPESIRNGVEVKQTVTLKSDELAAVFKRALSTKSTDLVKPALTGIFLVGRGKTLEVISCDGFRLSRQRVDLDKEFTGKMLIPYPKIIQSLLEREGVNRLTLSDLDWKGSRMVGLDFGHYEVTARLMEDQDLEIEKVLERIPDAKGFVVDQKILQIELGKADLKNEKDVIKGVVITDYEDRIKLKFIRCDLNIPKREDGRHKDIREVYIPKVKDDITLTTGMDNLCVVMPMWTEEGKRNLINVEFLKDFVKDAGSREVVLSGSLTTKTASIFSWGVPQKARKLKPWTEEKPLPLEYLETIALNSNEQKSIKTLENPRKNAFWVGRWEEKPIWKRLKGNNIKNEWGMDIWGRTWGDKYVLTEGKTGMKLVESSGMRVAIEKLGGVIKEKGIDHLVSQREKVIDKTGLSPRYWKKDLSEEDLGIVKVGSPSGNASTGGYGDVESTRKNAGAIRPMDLPEIDRLYRQIADQEAVIKRSFRGKPKLGLAKGKSVELLADMFKDPEKAKKTFAHEIGHVCDYLPEGVMTRGKLVGHIAALNRYMKNKFGEMNDSTIRKEAYALSKKWRPLGVGALDPNHIKYRKKSAEIYADMVSVLINDPALLKQDAPHFWEGFFTYLEKRPKAMKAFNSMWDLLLKSKSEIMNEREKDLRDMKKKGEKKGRMLFEVEQKEKRGDILFQTKEQLMDRNQKIIDKKNQAKREGKDMSDESDPEWIVEGLPFIGGKEKEFFYRRYQPIKAELDKADVLWEDLSEYLFLDRIENERGEMTPEELWDTLEESLDERWIKMVKKAIPESKRSDPTIMQTKILQEKLAEDDYLAIALFLPNKKGLANPLGFTTDTAKDQKGFLEKRMGKEKWDVMQEQVKNFRDATQEILNWKGAENYFKASTLEDMKNNPAYATFQVIAYMDTYISAKVKRQFGTLKGVTNVASATINKNLNTIQAIERNNAKLGIMDFMLENFTDEISEAKTVWTGKGHRYIDSKDKNLSTIYMMKDGKQIAYYVDKYIANSFDHSSVLQMAGIMKIFSLPNQKWFRPVYVGLNLGFQTFNIARDFNRFWRNVPSMTFGKALKRYWEASKPAWKKATKQQHDLVSEMYQKGMLGTSYGQLMKGETEVDTEIDRIMQKYGTVTHRKEISKLKTLVTRFFNFIENTGDYIEAIPKVAGYIELKDQGKMGENEMTHFIRNYVGSPNFWRRGSMYHISNNAFLFSNAIKEGWRSDYKVATDPTTRGGYWYKTTQQILVPKLLMFLAARGLMGDWLEEWMKKQSEYDKTNYITIPLGMIDGQALTLSIPTDETSRTVGGLFWKALNIAFKDGKITGSDFMDVLSFFGGQLPSVAPVGTAGASMLQMLSGQNPYDAWRNRFVINPYTFEKGDQTENWKIYGEWLWMQMGGSILYIPYAEWEEDKDLHPIQHMRHIPVLGNVLGRWIKLTDYGETEAEYEEEKKEKQRKLQILDSYVVDYVEGKEDDGRREVMAGEYAMEIHGEEPEDSKAEISLWKSRVSGAKKKFMKEVIKESGSIQEKEIAKLTLNVDKINRLKEMKGEMDIEKWERMIKRLEDDKIISDNVVKEL